VIFAGTLPEKSLKIGRNMMPEPFDADELMSWGST